MPADILAISLFIVLFFVQTIRHHQLQWLWFAMAAWFFGGLFSAQLLPSVLGITHLMNIYIPHFYAFLGSIFFFLNSVEKLPETSGRWQSPTAGAWLTHFALSGAIMHAAFLLLVAMVWWQYPLGHTPMLPAQLLDLYAFNPIYWYSIQLLLMLLFVAHRRILKEPMYVFSITQIQATFLLSLVLFYLYVLGYYPYVLYRYFGN